MENRGKMTPPPAKATTMKIAGNVMDASGAVVGTFASDVTPTQPPQPSLPPVTLTQPYTGFNYDKQDTPAETPFFTYVNPWNVGNLVRGRDYNSSITNYPTEFGSKTRFDWTFPNVEAPGGVYAYDFIGWCHYGYCQQYKRMVEPKQFNTIKTLRSKHNISRGGNMDDYHIIYDFFTTQNATDTGATYIHEFLILLNTRTIDASYEDSRPASDKFYFTDSQGLKWVLIASPQDAVAGMLTFVPADYREVIVYDIDLKEMMDFAVKSGKAKASEWFQGLSIGVEPGKNNGTMTLNSWTVTYT